MIKATIDQLHVPQMCKCQYHTGGAFTRSTIVREFQDHKEMVKELVKWNKGQGKDPCWIYQIVEVQ